MKKFDLEVGDIILANDDIHGGHNWKWRVISIHDHIFKAKRFDGKGSVRAFRKKDYQVGLIKPMW